MVAHNDAVLSRLFPGDSDMARRVGAFDWSATPLGPPERWPQSLKTAVRIMLTSRYAMWMGWGPDLSFLYNDSYAQMTLGAKHPWALGKRADEVWAEIWPDIGPLIDQVLHTAQATWSEGLLLLLERSGYAEETYHTFSYSPLADDTGATAGMFCVVTEETERIIGERRLATLADLSSRLARIRTEQDVLAAAEAALGAANKDLPFALVCLFDTHDKLHIARAVGIDSTTMLVNDGHWQPKIEARAAAQSVRKLSGEFGALPPGAWSKSPMEAVLVPIAAQGQAKAIGYLIAGLNPHRAYDDKYASFLDLLAGQISAGLASARAYEEERRRADALLEIDRAKTTFFSNVSHEFRTPLALMIGPIEEVLSQPPDRLPETSRALLDVAHRNSTRLLKLVNSLLDFTRIEAGRGQAHYEAVDLAALTAELASNFRTAIDRAGLTFNLDCPALPKPVYVDRDMWEKIVLNLLSNAFKFTFEGEIAVSLRASADGRFVALSVRDTGVGIPPQEVPRLFERFHRIEGQKSRSFEGSGIGLALVHELVKLHGGTIAIESRIGQGSRFTVSIPFGRAHLPATGLSEARPPISTALRVEAFVNEAMQWLPGPDAAVSHRSDTVSATPRGTNAVGPRPARILVADDNSDMRAYISRLLRDCYDVEAVGDGEAALQSIAARLPDLVLTDVMMPSLDGFGLLRRLRADPRTRAIPILLLSARAGEEARIEGLESGADDYLTKPFSARELLARVESNLKLAQVRREGEARVSSILESMTEGFHLVDATGRFVSFNTAAARMFETHGIKAPSLIGMHIFDEALPGAKGSEAGRALAAALEERHPTAVESYYAPWQRWYAVRHYPTPDGGVASFFQDVTERKRAEEQQRLLTDELNHRVKNTLAVIQAIATQTLRDTPDPPTFKTAFSQRLMALSRAHNLLTQREWRGADLKDVASGALAAFRSSGNNRHAHVGGPSILIAPDIVVSLSLIMHELATNAAKYGALSVPGGVVELTWEIAHAHDVAGDAALKLVWIERGGPPVEAPSRRGFGRRVIEASAGQLGGEIELKFPPTGAECRITMPAPVSATPPARSAGPSRAPRLSTPS